MRQLWRIAVERPGCVPGKPYLASIRARPGRLVAIIARPGTNAARDTCHNYRVPQSLQSKTPVGLAIFLTVAGVLGFVAAFSLTLDKLAVLEKPGAALGCNFSLIVQCGKNLDSAQGSIFGFPNPLIGIGAFAMVFAVGVTLLAGARPARWFWLLFNLGMLAGLAFTGWLIGQSIFVLGTLCPWCLLVWCVVIPLFLAVTLHNVRAGNIPLPRRVRRALSAAYSWVPFITLLCYLAVAVMAQVRLDVIRFL